MEPGDTAQSGVGMTAVGAAYVRARETRRPDRLFADPWAAVFVSESGWPPRLPAERGETDDVAKRYWAALEFWLVVRTRFLDEFVLTASAAGCRQIVALGAGLDARAFRLEWPSGVRLFELDLPDVLEFKEQVLSARQARANSERLVVPCDLRGDWAPAVEAAGLRAGEPTAWIAEGLLVYLTPEENESLLTRISELSPPGSRLGLTGGKISPPSTMSARPPMLDLDNPLRDQSSVISMWRSEAPDDPAAWLAGHGWAAEVFNPDERAAAYGRPLSSTDDARANPSSWLVSAVKL